MLARKKTAKQAMRLLFLNDKGEPLEVTDYQVKIIKRIFFKSPKRVVCTATTRAGKSLAVAIGVVLLAIFRDGEKIRLIAPTEEHTKIVMGYVIQHILDNSVFKSCLMMDTKGLGVERLKKVLTKQRMVLKNNSEIMTITANISAQGRSLVGWGGSVVIVDEAEIIESEIMRTKVMRMLGDSPDSSIFMIGNPVQYGFMYDKSTDPKWAFTQIGWQECVSEGRMTEEFIEERRAELTKNEFDIWYNARWPEELEDQLFTMQDLKNMIAPLTQNEIGLLSGEPDEKRLGCDIARFGNDFTVLYKNLRYGDKWFLSDFKVFGKNDLMKTVGNIIAFDGIDGFDSINVDDSGLGGGVSDRLREQEQTSNKVHAFIAGERPWKLDRKLTRSEEEDNKIYLNKKAFFYRKFESLARKGLVRLVNPEEHHKLISELKKIKYEHKSDGKMKIIPPEDKSPDFADSACISFFEGFKFVVDFV